MIDLSVKFGTKPLDGKLLIGIVPSDNGADAGDAFFVFVQVVTIGMNVVQRAGFAGITVAAGKINGKTAFQFATARQVIDKGGSGGRGGGCCGCRGWNVHVLVVVRVLGGNGHGYGRHRGVGRSRRIVAAQGRRCCCSRCITTIPFQTRLRHHEVTGFFGLFVFRVHQQRLGQIDAFGIGGATIRGHGLQQGLQIGFHPSHAPVAAALFPIVNRQQQRSFQHIGGRAFDLGQRQRDGGPDGVQIVAHVQRSNNGMPRGTAGRRALRRDFDQRIALAAKQTLDVLQANPSERNGGRPGFRRHGRNATK
mmetsp:Transcript_29072/g.79790  ORF Transcript_29072/g.79790 Transcript_29072/m.79790 type:complete len:307 (-) Transcript_29072:191-1111(-)